MSTKQQLSRFVAVGVAGTGLHYLVLIVCVAGFSLKAAYGTVLGAITGAFCNYWMNYHYSFESDRPHREAGPRYFVLASVGVVLNGVIVGALVRFGMYYILAQVVATVCVLFINFFVSRKWIFAKAW